MLQPHHLIDELDNIVCDDAGKKKLSDGPFGEILKAAQVIYLIFILIPNTFNFFYSGNQKSILVFSEVSQEIISWNFDLIACSVKK